MKKFFVFMFALAMGLSISSCKQKGDAAPADAQQGEAAQTEEVVKDPVAALNDILAKAKAEGANWSVDQWKDAFKQAMIAAKPMLTQIAEITGAINEKSTPEQITEAMTKAKKLEEDYKPLQAVMDQINEVAKGTENGQTVIDDEEWGKSLMKELGINLDI